MQPALAAIQIDPAIFSHVVNVAPFGDHPAYDLSLVTRALQLGQALPVVVHARDVLAGFRPGCRDAGTAGRASSLTDDRDSPGCERAEQEDGHRFEDAGRSSNYQHGAAWESATDTLATIDQAINALGFRLRLGAQCLIQRGAGHIAADGKFTPNVFAIITWGALARKHRMRKQTLMDDAREAVEAMALLMLDWVKVDLPDNTA